MSAYSTPKSPYMRRFRLRFTDSIYVHIPLSAHGFATTGLYIHAWDRQGRWIWPAFPTIDPATYAITVAFVQRQLDLDAPVGAPLITTFRSMSGTIAIDGPSFYRGYPHARRRRRSGRRQKTWAAVLRRRAKNVRGIRLP